MNNVTNGDHREMQPKPVLKFSPVKGHQINELLDSIGMSCNLRTLTLDVCSLEEYRDRLTNINVDALLAEIPPLQRLILQCFETTYGYCNNGRQRFVKTNNLRHIIVIYPTNCRSAQGGMGLSTQRPSRGPYGSERDHVSALCQVEEWFSRPTRLAVRVWCCD